MARLAKILLILIAAIVGIGVVASVALLLFFDPNDFREDIADSVKRATGRDLVIEGDISLSVFPWIAVEIGRTRLGNAEGFGDEPFLSFEEARLNVRFMPLFFKQDVAIGTAKLDSLKLSLQVDRNGVTNWDDLASADDEAGAHSNEAGAQTDEADSAAMSGDLDIANIDISNANVSYSNAQDGSQSSISGLSLQVGRIAEGSPFDLDAEFEFDSKPADIGGKLSLSGSVLISGDLQQIDINSLDISGTLRGIAEKATDFSFVAAAMNIDTDAQTVTPGEMELGVLGISMAATVKPFSYAGDIQPEASVRVDEFSLKDLMAVLGTEPPETADPNALQSVSFSGNAIVGAEAVSLTDLQLVLDDTTMSGTMSLPRTDGGKLIFDLDVDKMILDHYMAPAPDSAAAAGSDEINVEIPVDMIRALNASGSFTMQQAELSGIVFENLKLGLNSENGKIRLYPVSADMFGGAYNGDVRIDVSGETPVISVNEKIATVQMSLLAKALFDVENINGMINGTFALTGRGADSNAILRDLDGTVSFELANGEYLGTDVWYELRKARATFKGEAPPEPRLPVRTEFTAVSASGKVTNGVMQNNDFLAELPFLRLTGAGKVNFVDANMNYTMDARVVESPEFAGQLSTAELKDFTSAVIPLKISGPLASPGIRPDMEVMLRREVKKQIEKNRDKLLKKLLGGKDEQADSDETAKDGEEEEPDAEDDIKDLLKGLFGD
jgi:AsmA protein